MKWTDSDISYLKEKYPVDPTEHVAEHLGRTYKAVKSKAKVLKLKKVVSHLSKNSPWKSVDLEKFEKEYSITSNSVLSRRYQVSKSSIRKKAKESGWKKDQSQLEKGRFKPGINPWNAGRTGKRVSPKSEFKKGHLPGNTLHDGAIRLRNDRSVKTGKLTQYFYIRISKSKWDLYHRVLWKEHHGEIPHRHCIIFKDGNTLNCVIENLACISMAENARRNRNTEKAGLSHSANWEEGNISDQKVLSYLTRDKNLQQIIQEQNPDLIEVKRQQLLLNHIIKNEYSDRKQA